MKKYTESLKVLIIKSDRATLNLMTRYIQKWVSKREFKKHKIDFLIRWEWTHVAAMIFATIIVPSALYIHEGDVGGAIFHAAIWSLLVAFECFTVYQTIYTMKPMHDYFFSLRNEPNFNKGHAEVLEELFVRSRRERVKTAAIIIGFTLLLFIFCQALVPDLPNMVVWYYLLMGTISNSLKRYISYVNDFDEPKKKKKASEAISELLHLLWGQLTGGFVPHPA